MSYADDIYTRRMQATMTASLPPPVTIDPVADLERIVYGASVFPPRPLDPCGDGPIMTAARQMGLTGGPTHRAIMADAARPSLPEDADKRNSYPMADGLLDYFPNALAEVSRLSHAATLQHHPDKPMHWDRSKSTDHRNKIIRHLVDAGKLDDKGQRHSAMVAWRALALLQVELEEQEGFPLSRASRKAS